MSLKWTGSHNDCGILRKSDFKEKKEDLFVFGYSCKLFRDDEKALHIDQGKHLIPWMGDESLKIDRFEPFFTIRLLTVALKSIKIVVNGQKILSFGRYLRFSQRSVFEPARWKRLAVRRLQRRVNLRSTVKTMVVCITWNGNLSIEHYVNDHRRNLSLCLRGR